MEMNKNTMFSRIEETAINNPKKIAYEFMGSKKTYSDFMDDIDLAAKALTSYGIKEGDIICVAMPNMPQALITIYAANKIGVVVNMIHPLSSENEILSFVNRVNAKAILIIDQFYSKVEAIRNQTKLEHIIVAGAAEVLPFIKKVGFLLTQKKQANAPKEDGTVVFWNNFLKTGKDIPASSVKRTDNPDGMAFILHSGGTTGKVKGVCLSNRQINASANQMMEANPMICAEDRFLSVMPIFHGNGLIIGVHTPLLIGARCILIPRFTPETYARDLIKHRCNYMSGVPALFERLTTVDIMKNADLSFLKGVFCGADYLSIDLERKLNKFFTEHNSKVLIRQGYGMTEGVVATMLNPYDNPKEGSIGKPFNGVEVKIVKPDTEEELPVNEVGEIIFSSVTNMMYYYNDPEETASTLRLHSDGKHWIHSGDLGCMDEEGFFYFKGRIKRMIVTNGYNVFPNELENIIESFEMVDRCCILGVPHESGTDKIKAFIVLNKGFSADDEQKAKILELCKKSIAKYALPKSIEFIDELPKTKVGKVDYNALIKKK